MSLLALDPGPTQSALVVLDAHGRPDLPRCQILPNADVRAFLTVRHEWRSHTLNPDTLVIEQIESYGMPVGRDVFDTVFWAGRFAECWHGPWALLPRKAVKLHLCHSARATDASIRQALLDKFGPGRAKALGTKASPGPLYRIKADLWAALALAVTYRETRTDVAASSSSRVRDAEAPA